ncbi:UDP-glucuronosyltransferase [Caldibacillus lycopersici]|uniref:UDP-glucuronosyltransferase n=1 Tax=Perspicuibacillus lycopersici TaxID=1325689 RepID=A0AAE3LQJ8_9BACI|nr:glycosyltransferase [Perspicuibacillus lycopersici]MCU9613584.1 UDP-glucuronosyltransferase [Perspicuibacillus lycopersici]
MIKKVLFLPFMQIPSGHQQAADALISHFHNHDSTIECEKVDVFSYSYGVLEKLLSGFYLKWIHTFPSSYSFLYRTMVWKNIDIEKDFYLYELFFERQLEQIIQSKAPDCIVCTHALPSRLLSKMKQAGKLSIPVFNIYTDFFIHRGWGIKEIDGHFVSTGKMKNFLLSKNVHKEQIHFTGIPVHPLLKKRPLIPEQPKSKANILISGGSMGAGNLEKLINNLQHHKRIHYFILCGKNRTLYNRIKQLHSKHLTPIPYIQSRRIMDLIYNQVDLIITKPGGVTITECIQKKIPIFIYDKLPGQEEINFDELRTLGIIHESQHWQSAGGVTEEILNFLFEPKVLSKYYHSLYLYEMSKMEEAPLQVILSTMQNKNLSK